MNRREPRIAVLFVTTLAAGALFYDVCDAQSLSAALPSERNRQQVLVLEDGGILWGAITRLGDRYMVKQPHGEINIAVSRVLAIYDSLAAAYEAKRQHMDQHSADAHLALADWCLRHDLIPQAAQELWDARALEADHPRLVLLERRLVLAKRSQVAEPRSAPNAKVLPQALNPPPVVSATLLPADLPQGVVEHFTRRVQPILVNNCTASGCHQPGGTQAFQLDRALLHGMANRRTTTHNLAATLALVDRERPHLSPLLTIPRQTHGGMRDPVITPRQRTAFSHLVDWVRLVTQTTRNSAMPTSDQASPAMSHVNEQALEQSSEAFQIEAVSHEEEPNLESENPIHKAPRQLRYGARLEAWQPKDEFDPDIFNRATRARSGIEQNIIQPPPEPVSD